ncbi:OB-fold protein [Flectobacillus rivi]|uniref:tRNA_anti-like n=1 Tax=Flectobacillus rivi TaxID=2984209 RepID=A0ABT6Z684_9BACT|nr:hypothetical protein [Flectobacillus rivi]MDI9876647.1 hypothetical protein [Flectobacillus rivi]
MENQKVENVKSKIKIASIVLMILVLAVWYGLKEYNRKAVNTQALEPDYIFLATDLSQTFEANWAENDSIFKEKVIQVEGKIKSLNIANGEVILYLGNENTNTSIVCTMSDSKKSAGLTQSSEVIIKGVYLGYNQDELLGNDIVLKRCIIVN